MIDEYVSLG